MGIEGKGCCGGLDGLDMGMAGEDGIRGRPEGEGPAGDAFADEPEGLLLPLGSAPELVGERGLELTLSEGREGRGRETDITA